MSEEHEQTSHAHHKKNATYGMWISVGSVIVVIIVAAIVFSTHKSKEAQMSDSHETVSPTSTMPVMSEQLYDGRFAGFTIHPPQGWVQDKASGAVHVIFHNPQADREGAVSNRANMNVATQIANAVTLDQFMTSSKRNMQSSLTNYNEVQDKPITLNNAPARLVEATYLDNNVKLHVLQIVTISQNNTYIVTGTALDSAWNKYLKVFTDSEMSLKLKPVK